jgi:PAS domain S-box-containing protein
MDTQMQELLSVAEELAQLGSWRQDLSTGGHRWSAGVYRILGLEPDELERDQDLILAVIHEDDRGRIEALLTSIANDPESAPGANDVFEFRVVRPDGAVREIRARGCIGRDDAGQATHWIGIAQDVTDQRLAERELRAHYAVTHALRDWETFEEGAVDLLRRLGTALDYPMACLWHWDEEFGRIACRAFWSAPDIDPAPFEAAKRGRTYRPGQGKPGVAWQQQRPVVIPDVSRSELWDGERESAELGIRTALAFPALGPDGPIAVISFYGFEPRAPSESLVETLTAIGKELGGFLHRRRVDLGPRPLSNREVEILRLAAEGRSGPEIAGELFISPTTVKTHFENLYEKLGVSDRPAAVAQALRIGLIT